MGQQTISNDIRIRDEEKLSPALCENSGYETLVSGNDHGLFELSILVHGVHCAACIQKIESTLAREQDIHKARLNFSTHRLHLSWEGLPERANDYIKIIENLGYSVQPYDLKADKETTAAEERFLLLCLGVAGFAAGNIMLLSIGLWTTTSETMGVATRDFMHWISAFIALPTLLFSGRPFFRSALKALRVGHTNMDVPISLALILAGGMSLYETITHGEHVYFDSAVMLMFFLLIGRYLDFRARKNARSAATDLLNASSGFAIVIDEGMPRRIAIRDVSEGMVLRISSGEKFPVDGVILEGASTADTSLVTGETLPHALSKDDKVFSGTINLSAPVTLKAERTADNSLLADIIRLMEKAEQGQARYVRLADKTARLYTPVVHTFAALAFLGWWLIGGLAWQGALLISITVLIITCPCALGLAVPVVQVLASSRLLKNHILVKSGDALERLAAIDTVLLDKTGTLTLGKPVLEKTYDPQTLPIAASLASHSKHPLSKALSAACQEHLPSVQNIQEHPGFGLEATFNGQTIRLGSGPWCGSKNAPAHDEIELWLRIGTKPPTPFYFKDQLRPDAAKTIELLKKSGLRVIMLSGDRLTIAQKIAQEAGIDEIFADQTPSQKFKILENLKQKGHKVLMVGDGLNDAPVLAGADISMAPGTAIDMAQNAADIIFMGDDLSPVYKAFKTAIFTQRLVKQNFTLAILYNMIAIPLALCGLVTPLIAALAMSGSSLLVIANSFRLRATA